MKVFLNARCILIAIAFFASAACSTVRDLPRQEVREQRGVVYKTIGNAKLTADFFFPTGVGVHPAVVVVHGGGWTNRSGDMEWICNRLARAGFVAMNIHYRLAPGSHFPFPVEDVQEAHRWLTAHASEYDVDPRQIAGWGYSAGANLVLLAGLDPEQKFSALVAGGTPANLTVWPDSPAVDSFLGVKFKENSKASAEASPVNKVNAHSPPVFLYHGAWDWIVSLDQLYMMEKALKEKGVPSEAYLSPYMGHLFTYLFSEESVLRGIRFLQKWSNAPAAK